MYHLTLHKYIEIFLEIVSDHNELDLESISDIFSKYSLEANQIGQQSKLGIFPSAAVATDASPCAPIAR